MLVWSWPTASIRGTFFIKIQAHRLFLDMMKWAGCLGEGVLSFILCI